VEVCEGVQHAHQKGGIHRDLKHSRDTRVHEPGTDRRRGPRRRHPF
jgi:serine/threonine protein kinase